MSEINNLNNLVQRAMKEPPMTTPMTRDEIAELMARAVAPFVCRPVHNGDCDDIAAGQAHANYVTNTILRALEAKGCQIVQGEPVAYRYDHLDGSKVCSSRRMGLQHPEWKDWTETPLYAGKVQP